MIAMTFGDVFEYNGREYIFLKITIDIIHAAYILNISDSQKLSSFYDRESRSGRVDIEGRAILAFVTLKTKEFKNRHASFLKTGKNIDDATDIEPIGISISSEDIKEIKEFIKSSPSVDKELKEDE